eukprot:CAMPEP_0197845424 /NCGR_PEP_ID=MMETSP1438-20131217/2361_1 /TAXON_ID=1461541 /ORGANISM="Pterosperma sp., Strain CCMP1384" /LENGTH=212 /DNA_ID=CAMNT_0043456713 /DNA_START=1 /DNA_END=639 /DNA_ORIENTATION=+
MPPKAKPITVVKNFGGRRNTGTPLAVQEWSLWDCDPEDSSGRKPSRGHAYGRTFPWVFDMTEKAYVLEGEATLTPEDPALYGDTVKIGPGDMVTFPRGWKGTWEVHSFLRKHYAFFNGKGLRVDEASDDDDDDDDDDDEHANDVVPDTDKTKPEKQAKGAEKTMDKKPPTASKSANKSANKSTNTSAVKRKNTGGLGADDTKPVTKRGKKKT